MDMQGTERKGKVTRRDFKHEVARGRHTTVSPASSYRQVLVPIQQLEPTTVKVLFVSGCEAFGAAKLSHGPGRFGLG